MLSIKYVYSQEKGGCPVWTSGRGFSSDADVRIFWCLKFLDFFKFKGFPPGKKGGGFEAWERFVEKGGGGSIFRDLYGRLLWMAPYRS